jgi:hypothetical protein
MAEKELSTQIKELEDSLKIIKEDITSYEQGNKERIRTIATQLRAILFQGCSGDTKALLFRLAQEARIPLICFGPRMDTLRVFDDAIFSISMSVISISEPNPSQIKYFLEDYLETTIIKIDRDTKVCPRKMIKDFANTEAAHYDDKKKGTLEKVKKVKFASNNYVEHSIIQIAKVIILLSSKVLIKLKESKPPMGVLLK